MRRFQILRLLVLTMAAFSQFAVAQQQVGAPGERKGTGTLVLKAARVIDGTGAAPIVNGVVVILDDKIMSVGPASRLSACT